MKMKFLLLLNLFFLNYINLTYSQTVIDTVKYLYQYEYMYNTGDANSTIQDMVLLVGKNYSVYKSLDAFILDTTIEQEGHKKKLVESLKKINLSQIVRENDSRIVLRFENLIHDYLIRDSMPTFNWVVENHRQKSFLGYTGTRAVGKTKNGKYVVYYSKELPANLGPWLIGDLPGLVVNAEDELRGISFTLKKVKEIENLKVLIKIPATVKEITKNEFSRLKNQASLNPQEFLDDALKNKSNATDTKTKLN